MKLPATPGPPRHEAGGHLPRTGCASRKNLRAGARARTFWHWRKCRPHHILRAQIPDAPPFSRSDTVDDTSKRPGASLNLTPLSADQLAADLARMGARDA